jgi:peptide/nickel transport system substrate-binding protein
VSSYWQKVLDRRVTRRRVLVSTGGFAAAAAFLAACGGDDDGGDGDGSSGLVYKIEDETSRAKHGGVYITTQDNAFARAPDPHRIGAHTAVAQRGYSQLFRIKGGHLANTDGDFMGDLAESWELSPDRLTLTVKLEKQAGFAPLPPVNGRLVDADDIVFSWRRMIDAAGPLRGDLANEINPDAPIQSVTALDKQTVQLKLAEPNATIFTLLGLAGLGGFWIVPKEAASFDVANKPLGSGPYMITDLQPELRVVYKKNPNFKRSTLKNNEPYIEEIQTPMILEAATRSAQFRAGNIHQTAFPRLEMVGAKRDNPDLLLFPIDPPTTERVYFGQNSDSPWVDERLRRAFHRLIDRDAFVRAAYDVDFFEREGLEVDQQWEGSFGGNSWGGWLLDPKSEKDYGAAQKNFVMDVAEAKKLVEAAGKTTPWDFVWVRSAPGPTSFSRPIYDRMEIVEGMIRDSGVMRFTFKDLEWGTEWAPQIRQSGGKFTGTSWGPDTSSPDPAVAAVFVYHPKGGYFEGGDDRLAQMALGIRREFDVEKRKTLVKDLQRYDAEKMFNQKIGVAAGFDLSWPVVRNIGAYRGGTNWLDLKSPLGADLKAWIDETKAPINKPA